jgi:signal peptidase I
MQSEWRLWRMFMQEGLQVVVPAVVLALTVHFFLAQATIVYGQSMEPNLSERQRLIIDKVSFRVHPPRRNDIVVISLPNMEEMLVKRVIGLPGETVAVRNGVVYVNGEPLPEPFPHQLGYQTMEPVVLGPLNYFVLGDNRENSNDSRSFGPVKRENIVGRVWLRYWPLRQFKYF